MSAPTILEPGDISALGNEGVKKGQFDDVVDLLRHSLGVLPEQLITITAGTVTPTSMGIIKVSPETGNTDNLDKVSITNFNPGNVIIVRNETDSNTVTVRHLQGGNGQFNLHKTQNFVMIKARSSIAFYLNDSNNWVELWRNYSNDDAGWFGFHGAADAADVTTNTSDIATHGALVGVPAHGAQPSGYERFTGSGTFNVPTGVTKVWVTNIGGGGGGGGGGGAVGGTNGGNGTAGGNSQYSKGGTFTSNGGAAGALATTISGGTSGGSNSGFGQDPPRKVVTGGRGGPGGIALYSTGPGNGGIGGAGGAGAVGDGGGGGGGGQSGDVDFMREFTVAFGESFSIIAVGAGGGGGAAGVGGAGVSAGATGTSGAVDFYW
jgi:hypothetical protein